MPNGFHQLFGFQNFCLHFVGLVPTKRLQLSFASSSFTLQQNEYDTYSRVLSVVSATGSSCSGMTILKLSFVTFVTIFKRNE